MTVIGTDGTDYTPPHTKLTVDEKGQGARHLLLHRRPKTRRCLSANYSLYTHRSQFGEEVVEGDLRGRRFDNSDVKNNSDPTGDNCESATGPIIEDHSEPTNRRRQKTDKPSTKAPEPSETKTDEPSTKAPETVGDEDRGTAPKRFPQSHRRRRPTSPRPKRRNRPKPTRRMRLGPRPRPRRTRLQPTNPRPKAPKTDRNRRRRVLHGPEKEPKKSEDKESESTGTGQPRNRGEGETTRPLARRRLTLHRPDRDQLRGLPRQGHQARRQRSPARREGHHHGRARPGQGRPLHDDQAGHLRGQGHVRCPGQGQGCARHLQRPCPGRELR